MVIVLKFFFVFITRCKKGIPSVNISKTVIDNSISSYSHETGKTIDWDKLNDYLSPDGNLNNSNKNCYLKKSIQFENSKNAILGHLNINSLMNY